MEFQEIKKLKQKTFTRLRVLQRVEVKIVDSFVDMDGVDLSSNLQG